MKKLLFILMSIFISGSYIYAQNINSTEIIFYKKPKKGHQINPEDMPQARSLIFQPTHAYLYNKVVAVSFKETMQTLVINIIKETTGATVYSQEYITGSTIVSINLNSQSPGAYHIEVISKEDILQGDFNL